jgi:putative methyltransferase (TIGR04325 family)
MNPRLLQRFSTRLLNRAPLLPPAPAGFVDFEGTWAEAQAMSSGYGTSDILERVLTASLAVERGQAVHERDSVTFDHIQYTWPVLASLLWSAACHGGRLRVLDFGGSLGSTYRQNRRFFTGLPDVSWAIVEQPDFVAAGTQHFASEVLSFHDTIASATETAPHIALLGSSLQYVEHPTETLEALSATGVTTLVLDRTPLHLGPDHHLTLQHVPPSIYPAIYPAWILSRPRIDAALIKDWKLVEEFTGMERASTTSAGTPFEWVGMILHRTAAFEPSTRGPVSDDTTSRDT